MNNNTPRIINQICLIFHLGLFFLFFLIQIPLIECWFITFPWFLLIYFVLNFILMLTAFGYLMFRVSNIQTVLISDFEFYLKTFLKKPDSENKLNGWLQSLKTKLPACNQHSQFLRRYSLCFLSTIVGFACSYQMLYLINKASYSCNFSLVSSLEKMLNFLYFSFVTITTSGYGDMTPSSFFSKLFATLEISAGITFLVVILDIYFASKEEIKGIFKVVLEHASVVIAQEIDRTKQELAKTKQRGRKLKNAQEEIDGWAKE